MSGLEREEINELRQRFAATAPLSQEREDELWEHCESGTHVAEMVVVEDLRDAMAEIDRLKAEILEARDLLQFFASRWGYAHLRDPNPDPWYVRTLALLHRWGSNAVSKL